jgi:hypothetical protein
MRNLSSRIYENSTKKKSNCSRWWALLVPLLCVFLLPSFAYADLEVQFTDTQSTALLVYEEGTWEVEIRNPDDTDVTDAKLTITLPTGFDVTNTGGGVENVGPPHRKGDGSIY